MKMRINFSKNNGNSTLGLVGDKRDKKQVMSIS